MRYDPAMRTSVVIVVALVLMGAGSTAWANEPPALAKARTLYNAGDYEGAIDSASVARKEAQALFERMLASGAVAFKVNRSDGKPDEKVSSFSDLEDETVIVPRVVGG